MKKMLAARPALHRPPKPNKTPERGGVASFSIKAQAERIYSLKSAVLKEVHLPFF
jgi:hypothetical protein